jgi:hypothetical protein
MKIEITKNQTQSVINIDGIIKTSQNAQNFIDALQSALKDAPRVEINIKDSFSVTSTIIGFLLQKANDKNIAISINVGNDRLFELFDMLGVAKVLNVKKV